MVQDAISKGHWSSNLGIRCASFRETAAFPTRPFSLICGTEH